MMTPDRFHRIVDAYGSEPRRWPAGERGAAEAFARVDAVAALWLAEAAATDDLLFGAVPPVASPALRRRILAAAPRPSAWSRARIGWSAAMLALAGAGGVFAGSAAAAYVPGAALPIPGLLHEESVLAELWGAEP